MSSLQDQLLKAGLIDNKKAKQTKKEKAKQARVQHRSKEPSIDETKAAAQLARQEKAERDRQLNAERNAAAQEKAIQAQIKQLISLNLQPKKGDTAYNFTDGSAVKSLYASAQQVEQLSRGLLAIVRLEENYELVPAVIAEKIALRDETVVISQASKAADAPDEDDPYADYVIPDDLMW
ncbi:DUF2058 domain-containing protein [Gilvimarinus agarilyticus]|uniref:DUF2058 domain-containing protein n=1 Tax=unclassified Gilvimarinus TaxID=2642066 RepID=UPI001C0915C6|nr:MULTISPECIES: DUF2058 domain-containing protein [unclassified Gilvimarinus]MBU2884655.1 DUF2058 domain-containing protein [Gilvimarinus agarilyticus]MDO6569762.1 DUF2058 domain-containing protein [Gilvimarinus sp. 2_MG-2023]MDO6747424.1 DUF2058 domain-containing protein [Gilvimarinus sp. 1_MG-2023]